MYLKSGLTKRDSEQNEFPRILSITPPLGQLSAALSVEHQYLTKCVECVIIMHGHNTADQHKQLEQRGFHTALPRYARLSRVPRKCSRILRTGEQMVQGPCRRSTQVFWSDTIRQMRHQSVRNWRCEANQNQGLRARFRLNRVFPKPDLRHIPQYVGRAGNQNASEHLTNIPSELFHY